MTSEHRHPLERDADPLLRDTEGHEALLLGDEAIVRGALEAGVAFACGYPGTPSSEVTDAFARIAPSRGIAFEYSVNEKVALEMAFAASLAGARSLCAMKHLGLMYAGDPLSTIPYVGVVGGMVIVSAGDPSCHTSPNEQDQRYLGTMLHIPTLDPSTPQEAHAMTLLAFDVSERSRLPVLLRITTRVAHTRARVRFGRLSHAAVTGFLRDPARLAPIPANARALRLEIPGRLETARAMLAPLLRVTGSGPQAIIAAGAPAATCADLLAEHGLAGSVVLATLGAVHPLPEEALASLLGRLERVLVVEELSPFLEDALHVLCARRGIRVEILGKRSGHLPEAFEYEPEVIQQGIHASLGLLPAPGAARSFEPLPARPPALCPGCPHRSTYFAARSVFGDSHLYFNDIGCYTLGYGPPLNAVDALLCMGAGFTLAAGVSRVTGQRTVGFLGDSTFFHSGMPALLNAIKENVNMVAVILDNQVTAMTGFQQSPTTPSAASAASRAPASIERIVRALGAEHVETVDPMNLSAAIAAFERARDARGVSVIIADHPCPVHQSRETGAPFKTGTYEIDHSLCQCCARESCGMRCGQGVQEPFERNMARVRALASAEGRHDPRGPAETPAVAPCAEQCPLGLCIQGYAGQIAAGQYAEALELIMSRTPLPDTVCRVCHRPCEEACVHAEADEAVAINDLKRFVMGWAAGRDGTDYRPACDPPHGLKVAVVGAGPAGLAAAHDLRLRGYEVTLFDSQERPGGLLRSAIPRFRLPLEALERDVERILGLGVEFVGKTVLGRGISLRGLLAKGFDAIFLGLGAQRSAGLASLNGAGGGEGPPQMVEALDYLTAPQRHRDATRGRRVVVVGGGNAAIDAARTALRLGAAEVSLAYRRGREEMTALVDEIDAAEREGVRLRTHLQPVGLHRGEGGGLVCVRTRPGASEASGRHIPVPVAGSESLIAADRVILAVGQIADLSFLDGSDLPIERLAGGGLRVDPRTARTSHPRIFAGGDLVDGIRAVTEAIAWGQRAAWGIDLELRGASAADRRPPPPRPGAWPHPWRSSSRRSALRLAPSGRRVHPGEMELEERVRGFEEVIGTLDEAQARAEARRCLACGQCGNCRACLDLFGCPAFYLSGGRIQIDPALCSGCGVCADLCPNRAIRRAESPPS